MTESDNPGRVSPYVNDEPESPLALAFQKAARENPEKEILSTVEDLRQEQQLAVIVSNRERVKEARITLQKYAFNILRERRSSVVFMADSLSKTPQGETAREKDTLLANLMKDYEELGKEWIIGQLLRRGTSINLRRKALWLNTRVANDFPERAMDCLSNLIAGMHLRQEGMMGRFSGYAGFITDAKNNDTFLEFISPILDKVRGTKTIGVRAIIFLKAVTDIDRDKRRVGTLANYLSEPGNIDRIVKRSVGIDLDYTIPVYAEWMVQAYQSTKRP